MTMISIIMPVLNEEEVIERSLRSTTALQGDFEIIVVDGGSSDKTKEIAKGYAKVITSKRGRAKQMNAGAKIAKGDILLFLHADSQLPNNALPEIEKAFRGPKVMGGALKFNLDDPSLLLKVLVFFANLRANIVKVYLGDHGLFVKRPVFEKIGGFNEIDLMEDVDLCRRLRREGKLVQLDVEITTSARRLKKRGILKTVIQMQMNRFLFFIGVSPRRLHRLYGDVR